VIPFLPVPLQLNSKRLKAYKASLILFPRRTAKPKHGDSEAGELSMARQLKGKLMPIEKVTKPLEFMAVTAEMAGFKAGPWTLDVITPLMWQLWRSPVCSSSASLGGCGALVPSAA